MFAEKDSLSLQLSYCCQLEDSRVKPQEHWGKKAFSFLLETYLK